MICGPDSLAVPRRRAEGGIVGLEPHSMDILTSRGLGTCGVVPCRFERTSEEMWHAVPRMHVLQPTWDTNVE